MNSLNLYWQILCGQNEWQWFIHVLWEVRLEGESRISECISAEFIFLKFVWICSERLLHENACDVVEMWIFYAIYRNVYWGSYVVRMRGGDFWSLGTGAGFFYLYVHWIIFFQGVGLRVYWYWRIPVLLLGAFLGILDVKRVRHILVLQLDEGGCVVGAKSRIRELRWDCEYRNLYYIFAEFIFLKFMWMCIERSLREDTCNVVECGWHDILNYLNVYWKSLSVHNEWRRILNCTHLYVHWAVCL